MAKYILKKYKDAAKKIRHQAGEVTPPWPHIAQITSSGLIARPQFSQSFLAPTILSYASLVDLALSSAC